MTNLEKYVKAFSEALEVPESDVPALKYGESDQWDSVGHMTLIAALEDEITAEDVEGVLQRDADAAPRAVPALPLFNQPLREAREAFERQYFEHHLKNERGNMTRVAEKTGLERTHLYRKLKQLGLNLGRRLEESEQ